MNNSSSQLYAQEANHALGKQVKDSIVGYRTIVPKTSVAQNKSEESIAISTRRGKVPSRNNTSFKLLEHEIKHEGFFLSRNLQAE